MSSARRHLDAIGSTGRPVGSQAIAAARQYCATHLRAAGFEIRELPFQFSAFPGRHAAQVLGVVGGFGVLAACIALFADRQLARVVAIVTLVLTALLTGWLGGLKATTRGGRRENGVNLEARRGDPAVWLVAHLDSKSQPISSAVRTAGVLLLGGAILSAVAILPGANSFAVVQTIAFSGAIGGAILLFTQVGNRSDGAADNGSGVAAVLHAASLLPRDLPVGVLITDAEELFLAGATAWVDGKTPGVAINCDTVDDGGRFVVMKYGDADLAERAGRLAQSVDPEARVMRPLPGVLTDSVPFQQANWSTVTLSRGTIRTLNRIHTERDSLASLTGSAIDDAAWILAGLVEEIA